MEDPMLSERWALVVTHFPGASPNRVESLVTEKIEEKLFEIEEIKTLESVSRTGSSTISIELADTVSEVERIWSRVRDKLADVTLVLPPEASEPEYQEVETNAYTILAAITWNIESAPNLAILNRLARELEQELPNFWGVERVELFGESDEEILVEISPVDLTALGLTAQELSREIQANDAKVAAGSLYGEQNTLLIELDAELDSLERIARIPISSGAEDQITRLGDIASIKKGVREPSSNIAIIDNKSAVVLAVMMEANQRIDRWEDAINQKLEDFQEQLPSEIGVQVIFNQSHYVEKRINGLFFNLFLGILLVFASTLLMMGWKSALIVGSALPLSVFMVFGGMNMLDIPLHQMSVTGLVIALGLLIDNAIIVVDEVQTRLKNGLDSSTAVSQTTSYLAVPLLASTLTTVLAFMPVALISGSTGEFVGSIAISVILALLSSLFLSLTIVPALTGRLNSFLYSSEKQTQLDRVSSLTKWLHQGVSSPRLTRLYRRILTGILTRPLIGVLLALILPLVGFVTATTLPEQFFPPAERNQIQIELELSSSASIKQTREVVKKATSVVLQHPEVVNVYWFLGQNAPRFYYNIEDAVKDSPNYAHSFVELSSSKDSPQLTQTLQNELDLAIPSARVLVRQLEQGPPVPAPIELKIYGSDLQTLQELGNRARVLLAQVSHVSHTRTSLSDSLPKLALRLDEEQAQLTGLNNTEIAGQLDNILEGSVKGSVLEGTEELPIRVRLSEDRRRHLDQITSIDLLTNSEREKKSFSIPLSAISEFQLVPELATISRYNSKRVNLVQGFIEAGVLPSTVLKQLKQSLEDSNFQLPPGYSIEFGGEQAERNNAVNNLISTVSVLLVIMLAILVMSFGSFRSAGVITIVAICSIGLGLAPLWIFGYPLGFMAILGIVGLVGVAINDSIVVLSALRSHSNGFRGDYKAVRETIIISTRHVITTTVTTAAGFVPLLFNGGDFWAPLAICVVGGVGGATLLALFFVPCAYLLLSNINVKKSKKLLYSINSR